MSDLTPGWTGEWLAVSAGNTATLWGLVGSDASAAAWGTTETALPDPSSTCRADTTGSVIVNMRTGASTIGGVSDGALLAGFNAMAMLKTDGAVELLQFRDAISLGNGRFTLSTFLRGRRGTDAMAYGHVAGERFVMLSMAALQPFTLDASAIGNLRYFRSGSFGTLPEAGDISSLTPHGRDQMPYAPVHVAAAVAGSALSSLRS